MAVLGRRQVAVLLTVVVVGVSGETSAIADSLPQNVSDVAALVGSGVCVNGTFVFDGSFVDSGDDMGLADLHFSATSGCPSLLSEIGNGAFSGAVSGTVQYIRQGTLLTVGGSVVMNGENHQLAMDCAMAPTSLNVGNLFESFALACGTVLTS